ncbi:tetratricopeptide repeat protein [Okeania hirsuta]|nr:tetratricopeptide repeat protein [Okeania hirsuta]RQH12582.1 tetratricopeptide repeat protein [Okeania hirsuta]
MKDSFKPTGQMAIAILAAATKQQNQGIKLAKSGNVEEAISAFRKALKLNPNINLDSTGKTEEKDPQSFAKKLAVSTKIDRGTELAKSGNVEAAISAFKKALELNLNTNLDSTGKTQEIDPESFAKKLVVSTKKIDEGTKLAKSGNVEAAISAFKKALELDPNINLDSTGKTEEKDPQSFARKLSASTKIDRGTELAKSGNVKAAISAFKKALALDPNINLDSTGKTEEKDPQFFAKKLAASTKIDRGTKLAKSGNVEAAISAFKKALELNSNINLDSTGKTEEKDPQFFAKKLAASTKIDRGTKLAKSGNVEAAISAFKKALELNSNINLDITEKTQEKDPQSFAIKLAASTKINEVVMLAISGDLEAAISAVKKVLKGEKKAEAEAESLVKTLAAPRKIKEGIKLGKSGKSEEAVAILREALQWNSGINIYKHLSQFNGGLNQWADQVYNSLEEKEKPVALRIFLELVEIENETTNSGKVNYKPSRAFLEDLPNPEQSLEFLQQVTGKLADKKNRLISIHNLSSGNTILSIAYEPLLDDWITLQKWLKDYQAVIEVTREIEMAAQNWKNYPSYSLLLLEKKLVEAENYLKEYGHLGLLKGFGYEFIEASKELKQKQIEEERSRLEIVNKQLEKLNQLKDEFLSNTSHELRTPLNAIINLAESMIDSPTDRLSESQKSNLSLIIYSGSRLTYLINDILDFSKLRNKDIQLQQK